MRKLNAVFIASSLDGYIADRDGGIEWLHSYPDPDNSDMGYGEFMSGIDALLMGRNTFETVCGFDMDWPYSKPVFVLSNSLSQIPEKFKGKAEPVRGHLSEVVKQINERGYKRLYIDGGRTIQSFLRDDLIDEITITTIPCLLGGGIPLFDTLDAVLRFECAHSVVYKNGVVQSKFIRKR